MRILVLEDDADLARQLNKALQEAGYAGHASAELEAMGVRVDTRSGRVTRDGAPVRLTAQEYRLLSYLMHHRGKIVSRIELIEHIYEQDFDRESNTIEVFIGRLRRKLGDNLIETVRGLGYRIP